MSSSAAILHPTKSFDNWKSGKWRSKALQSKTEVIFLSNSGEISDQIVSPDAWKSLDCHQRCMTYSSFISDGVVSTSADESTIMRVCILNEKAETKAQMQSAYQIAREQGIMVLALWAVPGFYANFVGFMNLSQEPEKDAHLFDDDDSPASIRADEMSEKTFDINSEYLVIRDEIMVASVKVLQRMHGCEDSLQFYHKCGAFTKGGWKSLGRRSSEAKVPLPYSFLRIVDLFSELDVKANHFTFQISADSRYLLFTKEKEDSSPPSEGDDSSASLVGAGVDCLFIDLSEDQLMRVKKENDSGGESPSSPSALACRYRSKKGVEFVLKTDHFTLHRLDATAEDYLNLWDDCLGSTKEIDPDQEFYLINQWRDWIMSRNIGGELKKKKMSEEESDESFIPVGSISVLDTLLSFREFMKVSEWQLGLGISGVNFLSALLARYGDDIRQDLATEHHWTDLFDRWQFDSEMQRLESFKTGLLAVGLFPKPDGKDAKQWAVSKEDPKLIRVAETFAKSLNSSSIIEENAAESHFRWKSQNHHFVQKYILNENGKRGSDCVKVLMDGLVKLIQDRGDFTGIDLMGLVWHSSEENRAVLLQKLMMAMKTTLDYNTVHSDKVGWAWVRDVVMKHQVWLSEDPDPPVTKPVSEEKQSSEEEESDDEDDAPILFDKVVAQVNEQVKTKGGSEISQAFEGLVKIDPESWKGLCKFDVKKASGILRQDGIEHGPKPKVSKKEIKDLKLKTNTVELNIEKQYDCKAFLTEALTNAYLVNPHFCSLMKEALHGCGSVQFGPVKQASRVEPKSEEYASEGRDWPYSACVIDLVRCSVTVNTLSDMLHSCQQLESFIVANPGTLSICRCKNGFRKYDPEVAGDLPHSYTDIKFNVACKSADGTRSIIGEVQILLQCVLDAKLKAHELYEVSRSLPLYKGAAKRLRKEYSFTQQLLLTGGNEKLLIRPLALYPFLFEVQNLHFALLLKTNYKSSYIIDDLAKSIIDKSNPMRMDEVMNGILSSFKHIRSTNTFFGKGSGKLVCAILSRVAQLRDLDDKKLTLDFYNRILSKMDDYYLSMSVCFNLFIDLDHSVKQELSAQAVIDGSGRFPNSFSEYTRFFEGFSNTEGVEFLFYNSYPEYWREYNEHDLSGIVSAVVSLITKFGKHRFQLSGVNKAWIPVLAQMPPEMALHSLKNSSLEVYYYMKSELDISLGRMCDVLDQILEPVRRQIFLNDMVLGSVPSEAQSVKPEELARFQAFNPTIGTFRNWILRAGSVETWNKRRPFFPNIYFLSPLKMGLLIDTLSKNDDWNAPEFCELFGTQMSELLRSLVFDWSVVYFVTHFDCSSSSEMIASLLPNPDWPFFQAWIQSGDICEDESVLESLNKVNEQVMKDVHRSGSVEDYRAWKKGDKVSNMSEFMKTQSVYSVSGVIGDNAELMGTILDHFGDDSSLFTLSVLCQCEWASDKVASLMAKEMIRRLKLTSMMEVKLWMLDQVKSVSWAAPIDFGRRSGYLMLSLLSEFTGVTDYDESKSSEESKIQEIKAEDSAEIAAALTDILSHFVDGQMNFFRMIELLSVMPNEVLCKVDEKALESMECWSHGGCSASNSAQSVRVFQSGLKLPLSALQEYIGRLIKGYSYDYFDDDGVPKCDVIGLFHSLFEVIGPEDIFEVGYRKSALVDWLGKVRSMPDKSHVHYSAVLDTLEKIYDDI